MACSFFFLAVESLVTTVDDKVNLNIPLVAEI